MKEKKAKLVTVAHYDNYIEADLARQLLEDEGIKAFVMGQNVGNVYAGVPAVTDIELQAPESEVERAQAILAAHEQQESGEDTGFDDEQDFEDQAELDADEEDEPREDQE
jgi:hypothetical protein